MKDTHITVQELSTCIRDARPYKLGSSNLKDLKKKKNYDIGSDGAYVGIDTLLCRTQGRQL